MRKSINKHIVIGLGEIGQPLYNIIRSEGTSVAGHDPGKEVLLDLENNECDILHIAIPGGMEDFCKIVNNYINQLNPNIVLIHSSIPPGTTNKVKGEIVAHTPVMGKHKNMEKEMIRYPKMVGIKSLNNYNLIEIELKKFGFKCKWIPDPSACELGKLLQTSLYGLLIAWVQESSYLSNYYGVDWNLVRKFWVEVESEDFNISSKWPGVIGGHCIIPNIDLISKEVNVPLLSAIVESNNNWLRDTIKE